MDLQSDERFRKIELGIQLTFDKLLKLQKSMKKKCIDANNIEALHVQINGFMNNTQAIWKKTYEVDVDKYDFIVFELVNIRTTKITQSKMKMRILPDYKMKRSNMNESDRERSNKLNFESRKTEEKSPFFRPWK